MAISEREMEIVGDYPPNLKMIPGVMLVDTIASPNGLEKAVDEKLRQHPHVLEEAKRLGKDVVGLATSHGKQIFIGVGVASSVIVVAAATRAIFMHIHKKT